MYMDDWATFMSDSNVRQEPEYNEMVYDFMKLILSERK